MSLGVFECIQSALYEPLRDFWNTLLLQYFTISWPRSPQTALNRDTLSRDSSLNYLKRNGTKYNFDNTRFINIWECYFCYNLHVLNMYLHDLMLQISQDLFLYIFEYLYINTHNFSLIADNELNKNWTLIEKLIEKEIFLLLYINLKSISVVIIDDESVDKLKNLFCSTRRVTMILFQVSVDELWFCLHILYVSYHKIPYFRVKEKYFTISRKIPDASWYERLIQKVIR